MAHKILPAIVVAGLLCTTGGSTGAVHAHDTGTGPHTVAAVSLDGRPAPVIDGRLDDAAWALAWPASGFRQLAPARGAPAMDDTEMRVLYDDEHLYLALRCHDADPARIVNRLARRGEVFASDFISIYIDPQHDHRTGYKFSTTPGGLQADEYRFDDTRSDRNWRGIWWVEAAVDSAGWTAELKLPLANFRFGDDVDQVWGIDLERFGKHDQEWTVWHQMTQAGDRTRMSDLGHLTGLRGLRPRRHVEVIPYFLGGATDGGRHNADGQASVGADLQANVGSDLKANLTVNPDFAQVEADQVEINLTRFPTRFAEQRPFFVEGNSFFDSPLDLFFSRRIGSRGDILWGAKLTGKSGVTSVGVLASQTGDAGLLDAGGAPRLREDAVYTALRVKRDVGRRSRVGALYSGKEADGSHGRVAGVDAGLSLAGAWQLDGQLARSDVGGLTGGTDATGTAAVTTLSYRDHLVDAALTWEHVSAGFDANGTGFLNKEPQRGWHDIELEATLTPQWGLHEWHVGTAVEGGRGLFADRYLDDWRAHHPTLQLADAFDEDHVAWRATSWVGLELRQRLLSYVEVYGVRSREVELTDLFDANTVGVIAETNSARALALELAAEAGDFYNFARQAPGVQQRLELGAVWRPRPDLALTLSGGGARTEDGAGQVDGRVRVGSLRTTYLFTRDLFVRLFAQTERQRDVVAGSTDSRHLVSGLFGWEFRPKSHLFLAYNEDWLGDGGGHRLGNRVLVLKLSYLADL